jgi:hypothetical protein
MGIMEADNEDANLFYSSSFKNAWVPNEERLKRAKLLERTLLEKGGGI